jgi:hypothetical protein
MLALLLMPTAAVRWMDDVSQVLLRKRSVQEASADAQRD